MLGENGDVTSAPVPVIADVDTGVDDALALLVLARHPGIRLLGVSAVAGNVEAQTAARNTLDVLALAGASDVPVAQGVGPGVELIISRPPTGR